MTKLTDRYVRRGGPVPCIYPGTLHGLEQAIKDCITASRFMPDRVVFLVAVKGTEKMIIHSFKAGRKWTVSREQTEA